MTALARINISDELQRSRGYSQAVITEGGRTVWLAGHVALSDDAGRSLAGDFEAQLRQTFRNLEGSLSAVGGRLQDIVSMTVFLTDSSQWARMAEIRAETFGPAYPACAAITVAGLADPDMLVEVQAVAVVRQ